VQTHQIHSRFLSNLLKTRVAQNPRRSGILDIYDGPSVGISPQFSVQWNQSSNCAGRLAGVEHMIGFIVVSVTMGIMTPLRAMSGALLRRVALHTKIRPTSALSDVRRAQTH
jgi:hypothetical protein